MIFPPSSSNNVCTQPTAQQQPTNQYRKTSENQNYSTIHQQQRALHLILQTLLPSADSSNPQRMPLADNLLSICKLQPCIPWHRHTERIHALEMPIPSRFQLASLLVSSLVLALVSLLA